MIKNNLLFPWEEKESVCGGKLFLGVDVTLNPKLVYIEDWRAERRQWAGASSRPTLWKTKVNRCRQGPVASADHGLGKNARHRPPHHLLGQAYLPSFLPSLTSSF